MSGKLACQPAHSSTLHHLLREQGRSQMGMHSVDVQAAVGERTAWKWRDPPAPTSPTVGPGGSRAAAYVVTSVSSLWSGVSSLCVFRKSHSSGPLAQDTAQPPCRPRFRSTAAACSQQLAGSVHHALLWCMQGGLQSPPRGTEHIWQAQEYGCYERMLLVTLDPDTEESPQILVPPYPRRRAVLSC